MNDTKTMQAETLAQHQLKCAYLFLDQEAWEDALQACELAKESAPEHFLPDTLKGAILTAKGDFKEAIKVLRVAAKRHPENALPQIYLAEALLLSGAKPQGLRQLEQAQSRQDAHIHTEVMGLLHEAFVDA